MDILLVMSGISRKIRRFSGCQGKDPDEKTPGDHSNAGRLSWVHWGGVEPPSLWGAWLWLPQKSNQAGEVTGLPTNKGCDYRLCVPWRESYRNGDPKGFLYKSQGIARHWILKKNFFFKYRYTTTENRLNKQWYIHT